MKVLFWGFFFFGFAFLLHLIVWRIRLPKRQTKALLLLFLGTLPLGFGILWSMQHILAIEVFVPSSLSEYFHIFLFVLSFTLAYVITYSALEADSPSLVMIMSIAGSGSEGLPKKQFAQQMNDEILVVPRVRDLLRDNMIVIEDGKYKLTLKGLVFVRIFIFYRRMLKLSQKGG